MSNPGQPVDPRPLARLLVGLAPGAVVRGPGAVPLAGGVLVPIPGRNGQPASQEVQPAVGSYPEQTVRERLADLIGRKAEAADLAYLELGAATIGLPVTRSDGRLVTFTLTNDMQGSVVSMFPSPSFQEYVPATSWPIPPGTYSQDEYDLTFNTEGDTYTPTQLIVTYRQTLSQRLQGLVLRSELYEMGNRVSQIEGSIPHPAVVVDVLTDQVFTSGAAVLEAYQAKTGAPLSGYAQVLARASDQYTPDPYFVRVDVAGNFTRVQPYTPVQSGYEFLAVYLGAAGVPALTLPQSTADAALARAIRQADESRLADLAAVTPARLTEWTQAEAYQVLSVLERDADGRPVRFTVRWPDGQAGALALSGFNSAAEAFDAYVLTYPPNIRITQDPLTRDVDGNVTESPPLRYEELGE